MDGHHLHMPPGEGLVRVLVLIHAARVEQVQKAVEEVPTEGLTVAVGDYRVVVVVLKCVEELRQDRQVAGAVLVLDQASKWLQRQQAVEVVSRAQVEGLALLQPRYLCDETPQRCGQGMGA